ncbi:MAG: tRNA (N(6)-L-threonylcarbamoyladenosine(37)-C(2))-methylthiotransferase MtaB [Bacilli bacterium]|nr:tRNA (N(6)-L-threonylcarbamoyladenosine(37)-C(2))-methylthiotransferase MtaB [Bacilli bacterium]
MKKYKIITLGCKVNTYESESMAEQLDANGYCLAKEDDPVDLVIINTCTVTSTSDQKSRQMIRKAIKNYPGAKILVTGCYSQMSSDFVSTIEGVDIVIGNTKKSNIIDLLTKKEEISSVLVNIQSGRSIKDYEEMKVTSYHENTRAYLKIQDGCNNFCSYCIIPYARGPLRSRKKEDVLNEAKDLVAKGFKEIVLTGIHTAAYGEDFDNYSFFDLLCDLVEIDGIKRIRISSIEETEINDDIINLVFTNEKVVNHFHIPLQSGCDTVLKRMNRKYNTSQFYEKVQKIREVVKDVAITADVIVGFPQETEEEFMETYEFIKKVGFAELHVFPYSMRSGTPAARMSGQIDPRIKKERVHRLIELNNSLALEYANRFLDKELDVLFETFDEKTGLLTGHTTNYLKVSAKGSKELINKIVKVRIIKSGYPLNIGEIL